MEKKIKGIKDIDAFLSKVGWDFYHIWQALLDYTKKITNVKSSLIDYVEDEKYIIMLVRFNFCAGEEIIATYRYLMMYSYNHPEIIKYAEIFKDTYDSIFEILYHDFEGWNEELDIDDPID